MFVLMTYMAWSWSNCQTANCKCDMLLLSCIYLRRRDGFLYYKYEVKWLKELNIDLRVNIEEEPFTLRGVTKFCGAATTYVPLFRNSWTEEHPDALAARVKFPVGFSPLLVLPIKAIILWNLPKIQISIISHVFYCISFSSLTCIHCNCILPCILDSSRHLAAPLLYNSCRT